MKKFFSLISIVCLTSFIEAQTTLSKTISTTNVNEVGVFWNSPTLTYSTATQTLTYNCGSGNSPQLVANSPANNIYYTTILKGDTLSMIDIPSTTYFGDSNSVFDGTFSFNTFYPVSALTADFDTVFALGKYGSDYNILAINNGVQTFLSSPNFNGVNSNLIDYSDMDYFELNGTRYIAFVGKQYSFSPFQLSIYNVDTRQYYQTIENATSSQFSNGKLYYSKSNTIYELTSITPNANPLFQDITSTPIYTINVGQTINEFAFDKYDFNTVYAGASDGVYSTCSFTVGVDEEVTINNINLYPNPSNQYLNIENVEANSSYQIHNQLGKLILSGNLNQQINIENLTNGIYFLAIEGYSVQKFIKQ